jgi:hypothetical protein
MKYSLGARTRRLIYSLEISFGGILDLQNTILSMYRYDEQRRQIEEGYPKDMRNWRGVPTHIDGALTWKDGKQLTIILK